MGEAIFIFSWEQEKRRRNSVPCNFKKEKKSDSIEILSCLLFVLLSLSASVFD